MEKRLTHSPMKRAAAGAFAAFLLALSATVALAADAPKFAADAVTFTLKNGLQVVVIPDHRAPVVTHVVWYRIGAADDPLGKSGIAHFLEHLMFKGTKAHPEGEFSARVEAVGGDNNAFTTEDYTAYHQTVAKDHLKLMMEFEADRMANLQVTDAALLPERKVILEERGMRIDNSPGARLGVAMDAALYANSHYRIPTIGWASEMATLDRADALAFYDRYYTPNNAIVVVAGDVTEDEVRTLAEETYGKLARRAEPPPRVRLAEPPADAARLVTLTDPRVTQPSFRRLYLAPSEHTGKPGEAEALNVLADILGGGSTSRLYRQLVVEQGIAAGIDAGYDAGPIGPSAFSLYGSPRGTTTVQDLGAAFDKVIAELIDKGVTDEELARAKERVRAGVIYSEDSPRTLANAVGAALATGDTLAEVQSWPQRIDAVTAADVQAAAARIPRRPQLGHRLSAARPGGGPLVMAPRNAVSRAAAIAGLALTAIVWSAAAQAIDIQKVVSPRGITAWLVEDDSIPLISMSFAFEGGAAQDPTDKPGVANMLSGLLDEGAGDLDSQAFQARLDALSIGMSFDAGSDFFSGSLRTLSANRDEAARLLKLALSEPRFDPEPVERIRAQILTGIRRGERDPDRLASEALRKATFPDHPYGRSLIGTADSVATITVDDLKAFRAEDLRPQRSQGRHRRRHRRRDAGRHARPDLRRPAGQVESRRRPRRDGEIRRPHQHRPAGAADHHPPQPAGDHQQRSGPDPRRGRHLHPRWRFRFAPVQGGARRARSGLFGRPRPRCHGAFRHGQRRHPDAQRPGRGGHRVDQPGDRPLRQGRTDRGRACQGQGLSDRQLSAALRYLR